MLAPTGTISFMMDCDTTGVEPDFSLVKSKKLVGGGEITIVNKTVPMALEQARLRAARGRRDRRVHRRAEHGRRRAVREDRALPGVRLRDRRARDPLHGPREDDGRGPAVHLRRDLEDGQPARRTATVDEVAQLLVDAWQLGVKAIAIYRDNCKVAQPLSGRRTDGPAVALPAAPPASSPHRSAGACRRTAPRSAASSSVGEYEGYIHVGLFDDGTPGDIFVDIAKEGTTLAGLMNSFMISVSLGLQYGVPLEVYVSKFSHMRFEPSGLTNDADIRVAKSIVDYIFRWMGKKFLTAEQQEEAGILSPEVKARLAQRTPTGEAAAAGADRGRAAGPDRALQLWEDAVECARCGGRMVRTGSCYTCRDCGTNTGCS